MQGCVCWGDEPLLAKALGQAQEPPWALLAWLSWCRWSCAGKGIPGAAGSAGVQLEQTGALMEEAREAQPGHPSCFLAVLVAHLPLSQGWSGIEEPSKPRGLLV